MDSLFPMAVQSDDLLNNCVDLRRLGPGGGGGGGGGGDVTTDEEMAWFSSDLLSYEPLLNDCMLSQASDVPMMVNSKDVMLSSCGQSLNDQEFEQDLLTLVNPNMAMTLDKEGETSSRAEELSTPETIETDSSTALSSAEIEECLIGDRVHVSPVATVISSGVGAHSTYVLTYRPSKNSILKPQTIALSSRVQTPLEVSERLGQKLPKVQIRVMPRSVMATRMTGVTVGNQENAKNLPLSPPNSDSDGSVSPVRSERLGITQNFSPPRPKIMNHTSLLSNSMPSSGSLFLSEEEERTLISEGYPVPTKWPLTKQEEKILKKIQRKIKNKVSAQESRRKKKDYIDSLEKRLEASNMENSSLKKKVDKLEHGNRVLMSQIEQLKKAIQSVSAQTSTYIMVFVFCFAMLLGVWSPLTSMRLSPGPAVGMHKEGQQPRDPVPADLLPTGPQVAAEGSDYKTSMKSRTLLSVLEDPDESFETPSPPTCYSGMLGWLSVLQLGHNKHKHCEQLPDIPTAIPLIVEIQDQNRVETSSENLTEWSNKGEQKPTSIDRIYVSDIITVPASES